MSCTRKQYLKSDSLIKRFALELINYSLTEDEKWPEGDLSLDDNESVNIKRFIKTDLIINFINRIDNNEVGLSRVAENIDIIEAFDLLFNYLKSFRYSDIKSNEIKHLETPNQINDVLRISELGLPLLPNVLEDLISQYKYRDIADLVLRKEIDINDKKQVISLAND